MLARFRGDFPPSRERSNHGQRKSLGVSSSALTATNLFSYSYFVDGALKTEGLGGPLSGSFTWTYSPAGRELTQSDPFTGTANPIGGNYVARTQTYDAYGRLATATLPEGFQYSAFTHDAEGSTLSFLRTVLPTSQSLGTETQTYSVRGELIGQAVTGARASYAYTATTWNGFVDCTGPRDSLSSIQPCNSKLDVRSSMALQSYQGAITYDAAGRNTANGPALSVQSRAYDAENHLASQTYAGSDGVYHCVNGTCPNPTNSNYGGGDPPTTLPNGTGATYAWGPSGHLLQETINSVYGGGTFSEHWDGDSVLLEQAALTGLPTATDVQIGKLAVASNTGVAWSVVVEDRDFSGTVAARHGTPGQSTWADVRGSHFANVKGGLGAFTYPGGSSQIPDVTPPPLSPDREDGYGDGYGNVFQGVRVYDPTMAQWTAPDAYAGDVHDPMSQKPFMWNNNNPLSYQDPTGYYQLDNGTPAQQQRQDDVMKQGLKNITNTMSKLNPNGAAYKRLAVLKQDFTKGVGDWHIQFGPTQSDSLAFTAVNYTQDTTTGKVSDLRAGVTTVGSDLASMKESTQVGTMITEGGKFDMTSGRAGPALFRAEENALQLDGPGGNIHDDFLANTNYSLILHTELDCPNGNC